MTKWNRLSRYDRFWLGMALACLMIHATLSLTVPRAAWITPTGVGAFCLLAMALSIDRARCAEPGERWRWCCFTVSFLIWALAWAMLAYLDSCVQADFTFVQPDAILSSAKYIPLLFVMVPPSDIAAHRVFRAIDGAQSLLSTVLIVLLFFPEWFHLSGSQVSDADDSFYRDTLRYGVTALALLSLFYKTSSSNSGKIAFLLAAFLASYSAVVPFTSAIILPHTKIFKGSIALMVIDVPFLIFTCLSLYLRKRPVPAFLHRWPFANEGLLLAPAGLTGFLLILSFLLSDRNPGLGLWAGLATFGVFGIRVGLFQKLHLRTQAELARMAIGKAEFLVNLNHEIRSPMCSMTLVAARLSRSTALGPDDSALARQIHRRGEAVIALLNDTLELARLDAGAVRVSSRPFSAADVAGEALEELRPQAVEGAVWLRLNVHADPEGFPMIGDAGRLRQVLVNLLGNAVKFTPAGGHVTLTATWVGRDSDRRLRLTVSDTGRGISADAQAALFSRFGEAGPPIKGQAGSGLGLVISQKLVEVMGGSLDFESSEGRGSRFWIDLPVTRLLPAQQLL